MNTELFDYHDGLLIWKMRRGSSSAGRLAGSYDGNGYIEVRVNGKNIGAHRIIYEMHFGQIPDEMDIDHINGVRHDNRIENLRAVTRSVNNLNKAKQKNNSSGITGVRWHAQRKKWRAQFRDKYLGLFATIEEAEYAYKAASDGFVTERHGA